MQYEAALVCERAAETVTDARILATRSHAAVS